MYHLLYFINVYVYPNPKLNHGSMDIKMSTTHWTWSSASSCRNEVTLQKVGKDCKAPKLHTAARTEILLKIFKYVRLRK